MPYRRRYRRRRRRYVRRTGPGRKLSTIRRYLGPGAKRFFKLRYQSPITTIAGVFNTVFNDNPVSFQDWTSVSTLFDSYKFSAIKIQYYPQTPNQTSDSTINNAFMPFYIVGDPDDTTAATTANELLEYESCKVKNMFKPWKYYYKLPTMTSDGSTAVVLSRGYRDVGSTPGKRGVKTYFDDGSGAGQTWGTVVVTAYIVAKNRR